MLSYWLDQLLQECVWGQIIFKKTYLARLNESSIKPARLLTEITCEGQAEILSHLGQWNTEGSPTKANFRDEKRGLPHGSLSAD